MKTYQIYKATNSLTGKSYIGRTTSNLNRRISWHFSNAIKHNFKHNKFFAALLEYDRNVWDWTVIDVANDRQESFKLEQEYIRKYDAVNNGYNSKSGDLIPWNKGKKMTEEYRKNLIGKNNPMYGKTQTPEYRQWRSQFMSKSQLGKNNPVARKIYCVELGKTWDTIKAAADELGLNKDSVSNNCRGKSKAAGGYHFKYADGRIKHVSRDIKGSMNPNSKKVICLETNKVWNTVKECAQEFRVTPQNISKVLNGVHKTAKGFHFKHI